MNDTELRFLQTHSGDGGFLQSDFWLTFQKANRHKTVHIEGVGFWGNGIIYTLPVVGSYLYFPRGPVTDPAHARMDRLAQELFEIAEKTDIHWIRIELPAAKSVDQLQAFIGKKIVKAPHDMQPQETFVIDIAKDTETLLAEMKPKTRYNIRLAEKKGVRVFTTREKQYQEKFLDLIEATADRKEITPHPRAYYENFFSSFSEDVCQLFVAEYEGRVVAANMMIVFGTWAYYLHGGTDHAYREAMAPYLLQWRQICAAKELGCEQYDFGGVRIATQKTGDSAWAGITRFKQGFSTVTEPLLFAGTYDIVLDSAAYFLYEYLRLLKESMSCIRRLVSR